MITVTQALSHYNDFSNIPDHVMKKAQGRGTAVHTACAAHALKLWHTIDPEHQGYIDSFRAWFDNAVEHVVAVEIGLVDHALGYCGHPDLICVLKGDKRQTVVDYKTPITMSRTYNCQLSAYQQLANCNGHDVGRAGVVQLSKEGKPAKFVEITDLPRAWNIFKCALEAYKYLIMEK